MINYKDSDREEHVHAFAKFELRIVKINSNIAKVYFTKDDEVIDVPNNVTCYDISAGSKEPVIDIDGTPCFLVVWMDDYEFYQDEDEFFSLTSQRSHVEKADFMS